MIENARKELFQIEDFHGINTTREDRLVTLKYRSHLSTNHRLEKHGAVLSACNLAVLHREPDFRQSLK